MKTRKKFGMKLGMKMRNENAIYKMKKELKKELNESAIHIKPFRNSIVIFTECNNY
jgi:hypothetical protein